MTFGWSSDAATFDSETKRRRKAASSASAGAISFTATWRSSARSVAR